MQAFIYCTKSDSGIIQYVVCVIELENFSS